ncbi:MAG TPA: DegT/DnrJ/EryC1/StrS family aminotransferase [Thermodesulfobium narugense]|uniref:dTDP-4-amino-4,6-dideoxygalactose transaminase n=1 Tax=Thermodesulfobium acidiphilum TaxID=1794699 RepID=A0A2R4W1C5_THEAF|nr:DegT/DnrJ/EryC1/StrS family aminotransferase [Thermodesulfobium acidiphilum]AWB10611.1 dTDP-4-amino-4,6-dideoxygalactose transaminase [Thermodesulfobium acidiphilum]PMP85409.1 MAG: UDP-4-amino-4,6-dideoxy-N-acetyl-beta-L-altrosamine transaminase [Thermodesulfobium narugense]HEM56369.1 DegT/DnrJ/EryC1/StrS family aminotransferase [Thermodesulfobium narugense]
MEKIALEGGKSQRESFLVFGKPRIEEDEIEEVVATLKSGWISTGPRVKKFEEKFSEYIGVKNCIALNSCTAGLFLALVLSGIGNNDEVITTTLTFASSANVIEHVGAKPVFVDIKESDLNFDEDLIESKINERTRALISVHMAGNSCNIEKVSKIVKRYNLVWINDAAHAIETEWDGKKISYYGDFSSYSFYATKNITTAEGGMLVVKDDKSYGRGRILSLHGISRDAWKRYSSEGFKHYEVIEPGFKYNMTDIQAALGIKQLEKIERYWKIRDEIAKMYINRLSEIDEIEPIEYSFDRRKPSYHLFILKITDDSLSRDFMMEALKYENIGTGIHYLPLHMQKYYKEKYSLKESEFPVATKLGKKIFSVPIGANITEKDVDDVICAIKKIICFVKKKIL